MRGPIRSSSRTGDVYLTGPYKGAPFGVAIVVPAVAGPFDLGKVTVRAAIFVDKHDASARIVSDPFPTILEGIPLDVPTCAVDRQAGILVEPDELRAGLPLGPLPGG